MAENFHRFSCLYAQSQGKTLDLSEATANFSTKHEFASAVHESFVLYGIIIMRLHIYVLSACVSECCLCFLLSVFVYTCIHFCHLDLLVFKVILCFYRWTTI